jgi:hypothetical protein
MQGGAVVAGPLPLDLPTALFAASEKDAVAVGIGGVE